MTGHSPDRTSNSTRRGTSTIAPGGKTLFLLAATAQNLRKLAKLVTPATSQRIASA